MYRRPKFLEVLLDIRREMALEADHDVARFVELTRSGTLDVPPAEPRAADNIDVTGVEDHQAVEVGETTRA